MHRTRVVAPLAACAGLVAAAAAVPTASAGGAPAPSVTLASALPSIVRQGDQVVVRGRTDVTWLTTKAALQLRRSRAFATVAQAPVGSHGRFTIRWNVPSTGAIGPISLRVAIRARHHTLVRTPSAPSAIGTA